MNRVAAIAVLLSSCVVFAQAGPTLRDVTQARAVGMGGAHRAMGLGGESVTGNPASMGMYPRYLLELGGAYDPATRFGFGNLTVMDSVTAGFTAGLAYHFLSVGQDPSRTTAHLGTLAIAVPFSDKFFVGASARYVNMSGFQTANGITMDTGLLFRPTPSLSVGVSGYNLVDIASPAMNRAGAVSFGYAGGMFALAADVRADFLPTATGPVFTYSFGGEYIAGEAFPLRAGYSYDNVSQSQYVSGGLGYVTQGSGLDVSYRHELGGSQSRLIVATLKIQIQ